MNTKSLIAIGLALTILLICVVGGLYLYSHKKMIRDSYNQFSAATTLYEAAQLADAERIFSDILQKYPRSPVAHDSLYYVAAIMQGRGEYKGALEKWLILDRAKEDPRTTEVDYNIGYCLEMIGNTDEAEARFSAVAGVPGAGEFASLAKSGLGRIAEDRGDFDQARARYEEAMALAQAPAARDLAEELLGELNMRMFLVPVEDDQKELYLIKAGDSMVSIALKRHTTVDLLCRINGIEDPLLVRPNKRLLIPKTDFSVSIDKSDFKLTLSDRDRFFKSYKVGLGKHGSTPVGDFVINDKIKNPTWWSPNGPVPPNDPHNELGTRWMALKPLTPDVGTDYGIHGTIDPSTIGWESSNGCPRMHKEDAEELYMLVTIGTPVTIRP